jgi:aromatic ring-opening dioxygenase catalytic subunit (LigB family)
MIEAKTLEHAILKLAGEMGLLARFRADPSGVGAELGLDADWSRVIADGDRDRLRTQGLPDGITILVSRWFKDDLGDSDSKGAFVFDGRVSDKDPVPPANLVFAGGCSHVPDLLARPEIDPEEAVSRLLAGYEKLRADIVKANIDTLLISADCHFQSFSTGATVIGVGDRHDGSMGFFRRPDLDAQVQGDADLAGKMIEAVRAAGLEVEAARTVELDHGLVVPLRLLLHDLDIKVVPIITQPARGFSPFGARAFGQALRPVIEASGRRVGFLATGGLSHWLDPGKYGAVDTAFDSFLLSLLKAGRGLEISNFEPYPLLDHGQYEILNWVIMLAVVGEGSKADIYAYEPMEASGGGWTVAHMNLGTSEAIDG